MDPKAMPEEAPEVEDNDRYVFHGRLTEDIKSASITPGVTGFQIYVTFRDPVTGNHATQTHYASTLGGVLVTLQDMFPDG